MVEAGGIEPPSRSISVEASTCIVHLLFFLDPQASGGQDSFWTRAQLTLSPLPRQATRVETSLLWSPVPVPQAEPDERRSQLSCERVVCVGTYVVFARCLTRPPDNLGTPLPPQSARSNPIAPGISSGDCIHYTLHRPQRQTARRSSRIALKRRRGQSITGHGAREPLPLPERAPSTSQRRQVDEDQRYGGQDEARERAPVVPLPPQERADGGCHDDASGGDGGKDDGAGEQSQCLQKRKIA